VTAIVTARARLDLLAALAVHRRPAEDLAEVVHLIVEAWPCDCPPELARGRDLCAHELERRAHHPVPLFYEGELPVSHTCHALGCETKVPPRLHMCKRHWSMVPVRAQRELWRTYRPGQERDKRPSPAYLRAAAACIEAVAAAEGYPPDEIAAEVTEYREIAEFLERPMSKGGRDAVRR